MNFAWDPGKAKRNRQNHRASFEEAATVFGEPLALTYPDPDHSISEERFITMGTSANHRALVVSHTDRHGRVRIISARKASREYGFSKLSGGVRGKYAARYRAGTNLVLLPPDVAEYFPDEEAVNTALRTLIHAAKKSARRAR